MQLNSPISIHVGLIKDVASIFEDSPHDIDAVLILVKCYEALVDLEMEMDGE